MSEANVLSMVDGCKQVQDSGGTLTILDHLHFSVPRGQTVAIVGASGSGKSTLLSILAGLDTPSSGQVFLAGVDLFAMDEDERAAHRAAHVGFVFQNFQLLSHLSALENVLLALELNPVTQRRRDAREQAERMLERVGLGQRMNHRPVTLSGGEQQRVALARAFVTQPEILMADEPTGSLDAATGARIIDLMLALNAERGTTLVLVTHDERIARRCQRQLHLSAGRLTRDVFSSQTTMP